MMTSFSRKWNSFWYAPGSALELAYCRIWFFAITICMEGTRNFVAWGGLPSSLAEPMPLLKALHYPLLSAWDIRMIHVLYVISLFTSCIGLFTRLSMWTAALTSAYLIPLSMVFTQEAHSSILTLFVTLILANSRPSDCLSVDAWLLARKTNQTSTLNIPDSGRYYWPIKLTQCLWAWTFFSAAVSKLHNTGLSWGLNALPYTLGNVRTILMFQDQWIRAKAGSLLVQYFPVRLIGCGALALELSAPLIVCYPKLRRIIVPAIFGMQFFIYFLIGPDFRKQMAVLPFLLGSTGIVTWIYNLASSSRIAQAKDSWS